MKKIIFLSLTIILFLTGCGCEKENTDKTIEENLPKYLTIEETMVTAAKEMMAANEELIPADENDVQSFSIRNLEERNFLKEPLTNPLDSNVPCDKEESVVRITFENGEVIYTAILKCGDYKTVLPETEK